MHQFQLMMQEVYTGSYNILLNAQGLVEWVPRCSPKLHFKVTCPHVAPTSRWKFIFSTLFKDCAIKHILVPALEELVKTYCWYLQMYVHVLTLSWVIHPSLQSLKPPSSAADRITTARESEEQYIFYYKYSVLINEIELYACKSCVIPIQTFFYRQQIHWLITTVKLYGTTKK